MSYNVFANYKPQSKQLAKEIYGFLKRNNQVIDKENPETLIIVGGDGTVLSAFHRYKHIIDKVNFIAINTGTLGFYSDYSRKNIEEFYKDISKGTPHIKEYPLVEVTLCQKDSCTKHLVLNETTIMSAEKTLKASVYINDVLIENFRGTGLCVSTPSGSTAYNKSLGGAILHPDLEAFQLVEMASINNIHFRTVGSPLVLTNKHTLRIEIQYPTNSTITLDNKINRIESIEYIEVKLSSKKINFTSYKDIGFFTRIKRTFI